MKRINWFLGISVIVILTMSFSGCYTTFSSARNDANSDYGTYEEYYDNSDNGASNKYYEDEIYAEDDPIRFNPNRVVVKKYYYTPKYVREYQYSYDDPYYYEDSYYDSYYYEPDIYFSINISFGDPYYGYRPYWWRPYHSWYISYYPYWGNYSWYEPYWYLPPPPPYCWNPPVIYYPPYDPYWPKYPVYENPIPNEKRAWDKREPVTRPVEQQFENPGVLPLVVRNEDDGQFLHFTGLHAAEQIVER